MAYTLSIAPEDPRFIHYGLVRLIGGASIHFRLKPHTLLKLTRQSKDVVLSNAGNETDVDINGNLELGDRFLFERDGQQLVFSVIEDVPINSSLSTNSVNYTVPEFENYSKKTNKYAMLGILLTLFLIATTFFGLKVQSDNQVKASNQEMFAQVREKYRIAVDASNKDSQAKSEARSIYLEIEELVKKLKENKFSSQEFDELEVEIQNNKSKITGLVNVDLEEFVDLSLQTKDFVGDSFVLSLENLYVFDKSASNLLSVDQEDGATKIALNNKDITGSVDVLAYNKDLYLIKDDGVYTTKPELKKVVEKTWSNPLGQIYAGNLYLIDRSNSQVFRFADTKSNFKDKVEWLAPGTIVDLSGVVDMAIDGSIWTLSQSGRVIKFTLGNPRTVNFQLIDSKPEDIKALFTNENQQNIYLMDANQGKVHVFVKNGQFEITYINDEIKNASDLVVNEKIKKVIILKGSKLFQFSI